MKPKDRMKKLGEFIMGKGFYIALLLCVATIGVSGYYLYSEISGARQPVDPVGGQAQVVLPDSIEGQAKPPEVPEDKLQNRKEIAPPQPQVKPKTEEAPVKPKAEPTNVPVEAPPVYTWPVRGQVFSEFNLEVLAYDETMGDWRTHSGVDIEAELGTRVLAMSSGTVVRVYEDDLMGSSVVIDHGDGLVSTYQNLSDCPTVARGDEVVTGTVIGAVGNTAIAESGGPAHLHLEVMRDNEAVDPMEFLP